MSSSLACCSLLLLLLLLAACAAIVSCRKAAGDEGKKKKKKSAAAPPLPPGRSSWWWSVVETAAFVAANSSGRGFYHFVAERRRRYGHPACFRTSLFGHTHVFMSAASPDAARSLQHQHQEQGCFSKRYVRTVAELLGEHSLLCASHAAHRSLRRAMAPLFFNAQTTASLAGSFDGLVQDYWRRRTGVVVVVLDAALAMTFDAICGMLVATLPGEAKRRLQSDVLAVTRAMLAVPLRLPGTRFHRGLRARRRIMDVLSQEVAARRRQQQQQQQQHDFLQSLLLVLRDDQIILDNILTLIIAGQVTTATAITWMVKYLADNPGVQENLRRVQLEVLGGAEQQQQDEQEALTLEQLNSMEFAYKVVKESLRMASIVSWFPRVALQDCQLAGYQIKKGWIVNIDARSLHYDPAIFDDPMSFDPWRFDNGGEEMSLLAFGAGGRTCLGMSMAKMMMLIFLHRLVTSFRWEMADHDQSLEEWAMFPRLKNGCPIRLHRIIN